MNSIQRRTALLASSLAIVLAMAACERPDNPAVGAKMAVGAKQDAGDAPARAADNTKLMGASSSDNVDDATITSKVNASLAADRDLSAIRIDVDTQNGVVTLSGPAPSVTARERASEIARGVKGVSSVNNQLTLQAG